MREILFRGKRIDNGEWAFGDLVKAETRGEWQILREEGDGFDFVDVYCETVGQFTGLHDKNGLRIFEGDIVKVKNKICEIKYESGFFGFVRGEGDIYSIFDNPLSDHIQPIVLFMDEHSSMDCFMESWVDCETIGNIHDHKQLLEEKGNG